MTFILYDNEKMELMMSIIVNLYYTGKDGSAKKFADEMISSGIVDAIRAGRFIPDEEGVPKQDEAFLRR